MTICSLLYKEWWKLFIENDYTFLENNSVYLDEHFDIRLNVKKSAEKYYQLKFQKKCIDDVSYSKNCSGCEKNCTLNVICADEKISVWGGRCGRYD